MKHQKPTAVAQAKNSLRPFYNWRPTNTFRSRKRPVFWKQIQEVRQQSSRSAHLDVLQIVEDNPAYPFPGLGNTFPKHEAHVLEPAFAHLKPLSFLAELSLQIARLNFHSMRLLPALESLASINDTLTAGDLSAAEQQLANHHNDFGLSLVTLKKALLISLQRDGLPGLSKQYKTITKDAESSAWGLLAHYVYDLIDPTYNPIMAANRWLRFADRNLDQHPWYARVLEEEIVGTPFDAPALSCATLRYSTLSLIDLVIFVWRKHNTHKAQISLQQHYQTLNGAIRSLLTKRFNHNELPVARPQKGHRDIISDLEIYRTSFFFDEVASVALWRNELNQLIFAERPTRGHQNITQPPTILAAAAIEIANEPKLAHEIVDRLGPWEDSFISHTSTSTQRVLLYATLIADCVRRLAQGPVSDPDVIAELLSDTDNIHIFLSTETMQKLLSSKEAQGSPLLVFVLWELIYRRNRTQDNELDRRLAFMALFRGTTNLIRSLDMLSARHPSAATLLAKTCSRTFLERLFMIMSSVKDVLEARVSICTWLIDRNDPAASNLQEERDALIRELANLEARSDLDSTRVHVDEESLREWFETLHDSSVTRYKQTALAEGGDTPLGTLLNFFSNIEKPGPKFDDFTAETQVGSEFLLMQIVDVTLKTFVSDRTFGLDAYLSRRIRHGTLNGHVITPITRLLGQLTERAALRNTTHDTDDRSTAIGLAEDFRTFLVGELDHARKDIIQIRSAEHPKGLIQAQWRTAVNLQHLDAMIARVKGRVVETSGAYDVFPDIYSFCWDCLESDLAQLRLYMLRDFFPAAVRKLVDLFEQTPLEERDLVAPFFVECRKIVEARVQEVCGWFIRPVFRRDRYSLKMLISTTLSIVRELDYEYAFTEEVIASDDISLNRGSFDVFGDALFVLLGNAARHGKRDGRIIVAANHPPDKPTVVRMDITSEMSNKEEFVEAVSRIHLAFDTDQQSIAQAAVREGFSGLMKLAGLMRRVRSPDVELLLAKDADQLSITFSLTLPSEITVTRIRG